MKRLLEFSKTYPWVVALVSLMLLSGILHFSHVVQFANAPLIVGAFALGIRLCRSIIQDIRKGNYGVDILAAIAIFSTLALGEYWAAIVIALMLASGEALEAYAAGRAQRELSALLNRAPQIAHKKHGTEYLDIPVNDVKVGDILLVKPGEIIPVDATLIDTVAILDESSLTGESLPVERAKNQALLSGAVNMQTAIHIRATSEARDSQYQQIIKLVQDAANSEAPFVRMADRYAVPFTIVSLTIAGLAWLLSGQAIRFAEVLVVATPCPLLLGAPIALISGMSRAARHGVIIKNGSTLEKLAYVRTVAFDKTGTLTRGEPLVDVIMPQPGTTENELLQLAASAEQHSSHILARSLLGNAAARTIKLLVPSDTHEEVANGLATTIDNQRVVVGKASYLTSLGIVLHDKNMIKTGQTIIHVACDGQYIGSITFSDHTRENSKETLSDLKKLGISRLMMLTGDAKATAARIAKELGITDVKAECMPKDKVEAVAKISDRPVMMVGDGVNDAPVLAAAEVGMALGARGSTAATQTADVVVLVDDISKSAIALQIARDTIRIALQSIWTGIGMSVVLMLIAAFGIIPAVIGALLQELVDVIVIINALRAHRG